MLYKKNRITKVFIWDENIVNISEKIIYKASLCASALALWDFSSILSPTAEKPAPTRSPTVLSESLALSLLASYDAPLVTSTRKKNQNKICLLGIIIVQTRNFLSNKIVGIGECITNLANDTFFLGTFFICFFLCFMALLVD
jgi:hypothetical protein